MMYDLLIQHASIVDGTGRDAFSADVAIQDGTLVLNPQGEAKEVIDATGLVLCPGFIDVHSHGDRLFGTEAGRLCKTNQGITTELTGQCGSTCYPVSTDPEKQSLLRQKMGRALPAGCEDFTSLENFLKWSEAQPKTANYAIYTGHSALRIAAMGFDNRRPTAREMDCMKAMLREAMEHGSMGMSSGLIYAPSCYADEDELVELCKVVAEYGGFYATHMRNEAGGVVDSVREAIAIAERSGCKLDISHHKICGRDNWGKSEETLRLIHEARDRGVDVTFDVYPYTASSTALNVCLPADFFAHGPDKMCQLLRDPAVRAELKPRMETMDGRLRHCGGWDGILVTTAPRTPDAVGLTVQAYADKLGQDAFETFFDMAAENGNAAEAIYFSMGEEDLQRIVCDENAVIGTDGMVKDLHTPTHPRGFASFVKAIRYFVREKKLLTLEQMIHKMTGLPAQRFGLTGKGVIADGSDADVLLIRPDEICDRATYQNGLALCDGIDRVIVAGETVYQNKQLTGNCPGKFLPHRA